MGLDDLQVFNDFTYTAATEVLQQKIDLFNEATNGAIILRAGNNRGDFTDETFYALIADLIRRRNVYANGAIAETELEMLLATTVKVAAGTPPVRMDPAWFSWISRDPEEAGLVYGQQLAVAMMADMLNTAIMSVAAAMDGATAIIHTDVAATASFQDFLTGRSKLGDASDRLAVWIVHSHVMFNVWGQALTNTEGLFSFGNIRVREDGFGTRYVMTDSPALINTTPTPDEYKSLGLVAGAVLVEQNPDFLQNVDTVNGFENIKRTIQTEWTYQLGVKGFAWDKSSGGHSPSNAALASTPNWDQIVTDLKNGPGVMVVTQ